MSEKRIYLVTSSRRHEEEPHDYDAANPDILAAWDSEDGDEYVVAYMIVRAQDNWSAIELVELGSPLEDRWPSVCRVPAEFLRIVPDNLADWMVERLKGAGLL